MFSLFFLNYLFFYFFVFNKSLRVDDGASYYIVTLGTSRTRNVRMVSERFKVYRAGATDRFARVQLLLNPNATIKAKEEKTNGLRPENLAAPSLPTRVDY